MLASSQTTNLLVSFCLWVGTTVAAPRQMGDPVETKCRLKGSATYNLTFVGLWSRSSFPKMYPLYRPPAQWSIVLGRSHNNGYTMWKMGSAASKAVKEFSEKGSRAAFDKENQGSDGIYDVFNAPALPAGTGRSWVTLMADAEHSKVSLMSKVIPSPDWFVGVDALDLCQDDDWLDDIIVNLNPTDAGTDEGLTYTAPNWPTTPQKPISEITSSSPNHPASSFFYPRLSSLPPLARLVLTRIQVYDVRPLKKSRPVGRRPIINEDYDEMADSGMPMGRPVKGQGRAKSTPRQKGRTGKGRSRQQKVKAGKVGPPSGDRRPVGLPDRSRGPVTFLDCEVSEWGAWGPCSKTCGFGQKVRHRYITVKPQNGGQPCPPLQEQELCGSMRNCKWKHFSMFNKWSKRG